MLTSTTLTTMAKNKGNSAPKGGSGGKPRKSFEGKARAGISDELRQAVVDLGGDEDDLDLIAGVDNDDGDEVTAGKGKAADEVS